MKKKDLIVILGMLLLAGALFGGFKVYESLNKPKEEFGMVVHGNEILFYFDVNKDATYDFDGSYCHMLMEVKDGAFRVYDVECPNQICVAMGWVQKDDIFASVGISCIPNQIIVVYNADQ